MKVKCKTCNAKINTKKFKGCQITHCPLIPVAEQNRVQAKTLSFKEFIPAVVQKPGLVSGIEAPEVPPATDAVSGDDWERYDYM